MNNSVPWEVLWDEMKRTAFRHCDDRYPHSKLEQALASLERHYGDNWIARSVMSGHPILQLLLSWPSVRQFIAYFELLDFASVLSGNDRQVGDMVKRTAEPSRLHFGSVFEELRILYCFNKVGMQTRKLFENQSRGRRKPFAKSQDLEVTWRGALFNVEVTQLLATEEMARGDRAFHHLGEVLNSRWPWEGILDLSGRPYSPRHVAEIEDQMITTINEARVLGIASYVEPGVVKYVLWMPSHEQEARRIIEELGLEFYTGLTMEWRFKSTISPFRVIQKLTEKRKQATNVPWLLVIKATDGLPDEAHAATLADEVSEYVYDHENLIGVVLYYRGGFYSSSTKATPVNIDDHLIRVITKKYSQHDYEQTIILKNRFCTFAKTSEIYDHVTQIAAQIGWGLDRPGNEVSFAP